MNLKTEETRETHNLYIESTRGSASRIIFKQLCLINKKICSTCLHFLHFYTIFDFFQRQIHLILSVESVTKCKQVEQINCSASSQLGRSLLCLRRLERTRHNPNSESNYPIYFVSTNSAMHNQQCVVVRNVQSMRCDVSFR